MSENIKEEAIVTIVRAWYPDIQGQEEIKEMVSLYRLVKELKKHGLGKVTVTVENGEIKPGAVELAKRI